MPNDSKHIQASLSLIPTDWLRLRVAQVSRCRDLAIFVVTTDRWTDGQINRLLYPCACARGNNAIEGMGGGHYAERACGELTILTKNTDIQFLANMRRSELKS